MGSNVSRFGRVDDLRAVAATLVFVCHAGLLWSVNDGPKTSAQLFYLGRLGVAIFFVISGLVIYRPFVVAGRGGRKQDLWEYTVRRLVRIVPAYWVALAVFAVLLPQQVPSLTWAHGGLFTGFAQIYSQGSYYRGLSVAWSLDVELCFYVAAPLFALALERLLRERRERLEPWFLLALALASIAVRRLSPQGIAGGTILGYMGWFAIGMALARSLGHPRARLRLGNVGAIAPWGFAAAGYLLLSAILPTTVANQGTLGAYLGLGLLATLIVLPAVNGEHNQATRIGKWLGDRSYGIYLWHYPILAWLAVKLLSGWQYVASAVFLTLLASHLSYHLVERPLMRRARRFHRGYPATPRETATAVAV